MNKPRLTQKTRRRLVGHPKPVDWRPLYRADDYLNAVISGYIEESVQKGVETIIQKLRVDAIMLGTSNTCTRFNGILGSAPPPVTIENSCTFMPGPPPTPGYGPSLFEGAFTNLVTMKAARDYVNKRVCT